MKIGDLVLIAEKNTHRTGWNTGVVEEIHPSKDGLVRSVTIKPKKEKGKSMTETPRRRPVCELILLRSADGRSVGDLPIM